MTIARKFYQFATELNIVLLIPIYRMTKKMKKTTDKKVQEDKLDSMHEKGTLQR